MIEITPLVPILNRWALSQEQDTFELLRALLLGKDVDENHPLKASVSGEKRSWYVVSSYGLWQPIIEMVYEGYRSAGKHGTRMAILTLCATGGDLHTLFSRYDPDDSLGLFKRL